MTDLMLVLGRHDTAHRTEPATTIRTGLSALDKATGGLVPQAVWVIAGHRQAGRSILATQLARTAALDGHPARLVCGRDDELSAVQLLLAGHAKVPLHRLNTGQLPPEDQDRLADAARELGAAPFLLDAATPAADVPGPEQVLADPAPRLLVVDDVDLWAFPDPLSVLRRLRALARHSRTSVLVTAPDTVVAPGGGPIDPMWARVTDMVLRLSRPDITTRRTNSDEVDLTLHRGQDSEALAPCWFQGHCARIVEQGEEGATPLREPGTVIDQLHTTGRPT
jgi:hypothetical protein